ncbi:MAG: sulfotransferase, partial [Rhizobiales bacterium]|nr:sulfotransferase [Hyphomicrobiales bacterium]
LAAAGGSYAVKAAIWDSKVRKEGVQSETGRRLLLLLEGDTLSATDRSDVLLALGRLHEHDKNHAEAFACWEKSREIAIRTAPPLKDYASFIAQVKALFSPTVFAELGEFGNQSEQPVFIVGMPRSGTTLTEQIISSHPDAVGVGELENLGRLARLLKQQCDAAGTPDALAAAARNGELRKLADEGLQCMRALAGRPAARIVEKMPHHFMTVGFFALFYPKARFVHCLRNPFDTFISSYQNQLSHHHAYSYTQEGFVREYLAHVRLMEFWKSLIPERILTLPYEGLAAAPAEWAPRIIEFVGLPWHEDCLRFFEKGGTVKTFSAQQVRNPVYSSSVERWRAYETQLQPLVRMLSEAGYEYPRQA